MMAEKVSAFCPNVIVTANSQGVYLHTEKCEKWFPTPPLSPVSTIGAGDTFNAGLIHGILKSNILTNSINQLDQKSWENVIAPAIAFASDVCCSLENYVSKDYIAKADLEIEKIRMLFAAQ
jgi:fructokinase